MKKIDKDQGFATQVKVLCEVAERCMLRNNQIDMFQEYFVNEESDHVVENISTKTMMLFKYRLHLS
jgi:dynein intermediate chain 2